MRTWRQKQAAGLEGNWERKKARGEQDRLTLADKIAGDRMQ
jgi:hypothetical protein